MIPVKLLYKIVNKFPCIQTFWEFFRWHTVSYINEEVNAFMMAAFAGRQDALHRF